MSNDNIRLTIQVAPFAGAWIEIACEIISVAGMNGRSLRGSVD